VNNGGVIITKASGERELFSEKKLRRSLERSLAPQAIIDEVVEHILSELRDGMRTSDVYRRAFSMLKKRYPSSAGRYHLKRAIMDLGPAGYIFERFVGELLKSMGFKVEVGRTVRGRCVLHEVDVLAEKSDKHIMVECKFHNSQGIKSDVKVALYIQARFEDIEAKWKLQPGYSQKIHEAWLVTNTKITSDAIRYASCVGLKVVGWSYPPERSLQNLIEISGLHPLTCLTNLNGFQKRTLLNEGTILCRHLLENKNILKSAGVSDANIPRVIKEVKDLCGPLDMNMR